MRSDLGVSIAIRTFNGAEFFQTQLESILSEFCPPDEMAFCDDGSTDGTVDLAQEVLHGWPGIARILRNERRLGYTKNLERAIQPTTFEKL